MPDRDWYAEWLLCEVVQHDRRVAAECLDSWGPGDAFDALVVAYRDLTGTEPPPRPTEEEVAAWWEVLIDNPGSQFHGVVGPRETRLRLRRAAASDDPRERMMARAVVEMPTGGGL